MINFKTPSEFYDAALEQHVSAVSALREAKAAYEAAKEHKRFADLALKEAKRLFAVP